MTPEELASFHNEQIDSMVGALETAQSRLSAKVMSALAAANAEPSKAISAAFWSDKLKNMQPILSQMADIFGNWLGDSGHGGIADAVIDGQSLARAILEGAGLEQQTELPYYGKAVSALLGDAQATFDDALGTATTKINRLFRQTQQDLISEAQLNEGLAADMISGDRIGSTLAQDLAQASEDGQFITINGRNYQISDYAELVARTKTRAAQKMASIATMKEFDHDLVEVVGSEPCDECQEIIDGGPYSISGDSDEYDQFEDGFEFPPHPRCTCVTSPYFEDDAKANEDGEDSADEVAADSKDDSEE